MVPRQILAAAAVVLLAGPALGQNFITYQQGQPGKSRAILQRAEQCRADIAEAWLGEKLPDWETPCVIVWSEDGSSGAGRTNYSKAGPLGRTTMRVRGRWDKVFYDVIPHEVMHLVLRDHLGFAQPRWFAEGAASTAETDESISSMERRLIGYLKTNRGLRFSRMTSAREYPPDVDPFYTQSASVARFLLAKRGPEAYLRLAQRHREVDDWVVAVREVYGFESLLQWQNEWLDWVRNGSPDIPRDGALVAARMRPIPMSQAPYRPRSMVAFSGQCGDCSSCESDVCSSSPTQPSRPAQPVRSVSPRPGPAGKDGKDGADGRDGRDGSDGADGRGVQGLEFTDGDLVVTYTDGHKQTLDGFAGAIAGQLPPFYPQWVDDDGNVIDSLPGGVRLGQTMPLRIEAKVVEADARTQPE